MINMGGPFYNIFFQDFFEGIIPPFYPKKPLYKGGYGGGDPIGGGIRGESTPYRGEC